MRTTDDKKDKTVKLRINEDMHRYLDTKSKRSNISVSEYVRNLIDVDMRFSKISKK